MSPRTVLMKKRGKGSTSSTQKKRKPPSTIQRGLLRLGNKFMLSKPGYPGWCIDEWVGGPERKFDKSWLEDTALKVVQKACKDMNL